MNEVILALQAVCGILIVLVFAFFCMLGGRSIEQLKAVGLGLWGWDKANRFWGRFFSPLVFGLGIIGLSLWTGHLEWPVFAFICVIWASTTLPHKSPLKRIIKALIWSGAGFFLCLIAGHWWLLLLQVVIGVTAQLILGTKNELISSQEEFSIYFLMSVVQPLMIL